MIHILPLACFLKRLSVSSVTQSVLKVFIGLFLFLHSPGIGQAQSIALRDAISQAPVAGARLMQGDSLLHTSNAHGQLPVNALPAKGLVVLQHPGYQSYSFSETPASQVIWLIPAAHELQEVTVQTYGNSNRARLMPAALALRDRAQLQQLPDASPGQVFNHIPGVVMHSGARNTHRLSIRGIGSRSQYTTSKIRAYWNEIPLTVGSGETSLEDMTWGVVDRLNVLKGPGASHYGAALGGTVLYKTGLPEQPGWQFSQRAQVADYNTWQTQSQLSWRQASSAVKAHYSQTGSQGYRHNSTFSRQAATVFGHHQFNPVWYAQLLARWMKVRAEIPSSLSEADFLNHPQRAAGSWNRVQGFERYRQGMYGLSLFADFSAHTRAVASVFARHQTGYERRPFNTLADDSRTAGVRTYVKGQYPAGNNQQWEWSIGAELYAEQYDWQILETLDAGGAGSELSRHEQVRGHQDYFAHVRWEWKGWAISSGMNLNNTAYRYETFAGGGDTQRQVFDWVLSPRVSLLYQLSQPVTLYANVSHGFSAPAFEEALDASGQISTDLQPETGWNRELGARIRWKPADINAELTLYSMQVNNLLVTERLAEDVFFKRNAGNTLHRGLEGYIRWKAWDTESSHAIFTTGLGMNDYQFQDFTDDGKNYEGHALPGIPRWQGTASARLRIASRWLWHARLLAVGRMPLNDANALYSDAYQRIDTRLAYTVVQRNGWYVQLHAAVRNLLDAHYAGMILVNAPSFGDSAPRYYYPARPRHWAAGFALRYRL